MRKFLVLAAIAGMITLSRSQERFEPETYMRNLETLRSGQISEVGKNEKCGLRYSLERIIHWNEFTHAQQTSLLELASPPQLQTNRLIGLFRIHYDTAGANTPSLLQGDTVRIPGTAEAYVDSVGRIFNEAYHFQVNSLGYGDPFQPGQSAYDIYIMGLNLYGLTESVQRIGSTDPPRYTSYITIDNDYYRFYSPGMSGLKVTAAHEFHHAIQLASYGFWNGDAYFLEITSTWMEDVEYDEINDYIQYLRSPSGVARGQFNSPEIRFTTTDGLIEYSRAIWGKFIEKRFSRAMMRRIWEEIRQAPSLQAMDAALVAGGRSFRDAFLEWAVWNQNTGPDADTVAFYTEGRQYPEVRTRPRIDFPSQRVIVDSIQLLSSMHYIVDIYNESQTRVGEMRVIVSNLNRSSTSNRYRFSYEMASEGGDAAFKHLANGLFVRLDVPDPANWATQENAPGIIQEVLVYPNPFLPRESKPLRFRLPVATQTQTGLLNIFSASLDAVFTSEVPIITEIGHPSEPLMLWDGRIASQSIPSGVYFFVITVDDQQYQGKFSVVRE